MTNNLYLMYDKIARTAFGGMIRVGNDEVARRAFHNTLAKGAAEMPGDPEHYQLLRVGTIDETTGQIDGYDIPNTVADGQDWVNANKENK